MEAESETPGEPATNKTTIDSPYEDADTSVHAFNVSAVDSTVIERTFAKSSETGKKTALFEGSDSGVEVLENPESCAYRRTPSSNSGNDFDHPGARSCDSSIISCCSNYEEAYNSLVRKNSTLLEDYTRNGDVTSENGSESSSISGSQPRSNRRSALGAAKKKVSVSETKRCAQSKDRSKCKPPVTPKTSSSSGQARLKSIDRLQGKSIPNGRTKAAPNCLDLSGVKKDLKRPASSAARSNKTPTSTPSDDGRWPSINSKPAPLMSRSLKGFPSQTDTKTIEKYATLPRRRKEKSAESIKEQKKTSSRENSMHRIALRSLRTSRETTPLKTTGSPSFLPKSKQKTKIYHEICIQTALTMTDVEKALSGVSVSPKSPVDAEKTEKEVQVDTRTREVEKLQEQLRKLNYRYEALFKEHEEQKSQLKDMTVERNSLKNELEINSQRVLAILGAETEASNSSDSLMVLETRFQNVGTVVIKQEEEISKLNNVCRLLQIDLEKSLDVQKILYRRHEDLEAESIELQEFMQAEKTTIHEAMKELEVELQKSQTVVSLKDKELAELKEELKSLTRLGEHRRQENLHLQARLGVLESKSRELLVHQGSSVSGAAVALSALIGRLDGLVEELVAAYSISEQELDDVIFHNEVYNNSSSSPESTPEKGRKSIADKTPSPQKGSSFVSAVINAIKNAAAQSPFSARDISKDNLCTDRSSSNEMLDSETEPCLMMEHVLEDVVVPDGHSHNLISSGHGSMMGSRLTHSESLVDVSHAVLHRQVSERAGSVSLNNSYTSDLASLGDIFPSVSLVDQVIDVDNLVTRLLKVIRIIQLETDDCMNELQDQKDALQDQVGKQNETNVMVVKQLKDWEVLGARLKSEVRELMCQMSRKNNEMDDIKGELNKQREEVEKLNQDVCELSTALSKAELEMKIKEEEVAGEIKKWEKTGEMPTADVLGQLVVCQNEIPILKEKLTEKERHLEELTQEFLASKQVLAENLKEAVNESKKQYEAIDGALDILHSIQSVVQQCPPLAKLQKDLEEISFQSASAMPIVPPSDCGLNLLQAVANLERTPTINTTA